MNSKFCKLVIFTLICGLSLAGLFPSAMHEQYENFRIESRHVCDQTKPTEFPASVRGRVNCSSFGMNPNGMYFCNDSPCQKKNGYGTCSWQFYEDLYFLDGDTTSSLYPCYACSTETCGGRYYQDRSTCTGNMVTSKYGHIWHCFDQSCQGAMEKQSNGTYACVDPSCAGISVYDPIKTRWICKEATCSGSNALTYNENTKSWQCEDSRCEGNMVRVNGGWACVSSSCSTPMVLESNTWVCLDKSGFVAFMPWLVIIVLVAVVFVLIRRSQNQAKELSNPMTRA